jgi:pyrroline-5-carboxylate reductase
MLKLGGTLVLVGAGKMGGAMLEGWLKGGADPAKVVAIDPAPPAEVKAMLEQRACASIRQFRASPMRKSSSWR